MTKIVDTNSRKSGTTALIIFCFLASGAVRLASSAPAIAQEMGGRRSYDQVEPAANPMVHAELESCEPMGDPSVLLSAISTRQDQLAEREAYIDSREQTLKVVELRIEEQLIALRAAEEQLAATLAQADDAAENDVAQLTEVYERMKPGDAAPIFETMDIQFSAGFFARMRPDAAANIMAELPAELAYSISVVMAGRNARAPRE
ncbi:MAG: hypothetical protein JKY31_09385 [Rhodobacteraceae bacterium]|nr:hypothetical protein [Paracoccaceae bacterium]